ncbi:DUF6455 family protein [Roseibium aestuarii]|uniref:DUF6455 family protein n=1 Tax=Roseibium aestuarii TaxID=2600299 RepID=A0ABW4JRT1_9HYPH|nr:DUF6455 family protein [Roseibium aestuarii]
MNERAALMGRMLEAIGAMDHAPDGQCLGHDLRQAAGTCMGCNQAEACAHWLDAHPEGAGQAPEICPNRRLFASWKEN